MNTHTVWQQYSVDLQKFIISKVKNTSVADDILQDVFIKIHTNLHTLKELSKLKPWCFSIARNTILDYWKTSKITFEFPNFDTESEIHREHHTEKDCLRGIIEKLPKKYKDPLFLADIKGLKQEEVAKKLHQSVSTTKSQIQRARKLIAQGFMDCCGFVMNDQGNLVGEIQEKENCNICK